MNVSTWRVRCVVCLEASAQNHTKTIEQDMKGRKIREKGEKGAVRPGPVEGFGR